MEKSQKRKFLANGDFFSLSVGSHECTQLSQDSFRFSFEKAALEDRQGRPFLDLPTMRPSIRSLLLIEMMA